MKNNSQVVFMAGVGLFLGLVLSAFLVPGGAESLLRPGVLLTIVASLASIAVVAVALTIGLEIKARRRTCGGLGGTWTALSAVLYAVTYFVAPPMPIRHLVVRDGIDLWTTIRWLALAVLLASILAHLRGAFRSNDRLRKQLQEVKADLVAFKERTLGVDDD